MSLPTDEIFIPFNSSVSIADRLRAKAASYQNDYFVNQDLEDIDETNEYVRPLQKITAIIYKDKIKRDLKTKAKKLQFAFDNFDKDWCQRFRLNLEANRFQ